jgi:hypothetical protein
VSNATAAQGVLNRLQQSVRPRFGKPSPCLRREQSQSCPQTHRSCACAGPERLWIYPVSSVVRCAPRARVPQQRHRISVIGLRPRHRVALSVSGHRQRVDRIHRPSRGPQGGDQQAARGFDRRGHRVLDSSKESSRSAVPRTCSGGSWRQGRRPTCPVAAMNGRHGVSGYRLFTLKTANRPDSPGSVHP